MSTTSDKATCVMTRKFFKLKRRAPAPLAPDSFFNIGTRSGFEALKAGAKPKISDVSNDSNNVKPSTRSLSLASSVRFALPFGGV